MPDAYVYNVQLKKTVYGPAPLKKARNWALKWAGNREFDPYPVTYIVIDEAGSQMGGPAENFAARYERKSHGNHLEVSARTEV